MNTKEKHWFKAIVRKYSTDNLANVIYDLLEEDGQVCLLDLTDEMREELRELKSIEVNHDIIKMR